MPVLATPDYLPPRFLRYANTATLYPSLLRPAIQADPLTERIELTDGDFLDVDRHPSRIGLSRKLAVISHGLEGNARRKYVLGMARMMTGLGFDAACWNQRGCGPEMNRLPRFYHSGETEDLHAVLTHCLENGQYDQAVLIGFSMGGNQILKYLGEAPERVPSEVAGATVFSVPCDLSATERVLAKPSRLIYVEYFMHGLRKKVHAKASRFPDHIDPAGLSGCHSLRLFDDRYTAPLNGFRDAADYYAKASSIGRLDAIRVPTLLVNAADDPFLARECYPVGQAEANANLFLEMPDFGGHVGFATPGPENIYWSEKRAGAFALEVSG